MEKFYSPDTFLAQLTGSASADPGQLLQYFGDIQYHYSCI
jgi:hypothetical protein